jgi:hypothetical protein
LRGEFVRVLQLGVNLLFRVSLPRHARSPGTEVSSLDTTRTRSSGATICNLAETPIGVNKSNGTHCTDNRLLCKYLPAGNRRAGENEAERGVLGLRYLRNTVQVFCEVKTKKISTSTSRFSRTRFRPLSSITNLLWCANFDASSC